MIYSWSYVIGCDNFLAQPLSSLELIIVLVLFVLHILSSCHLFDSNLCYFTKTPLKNTRCWHFLLLMSHVADHLTGFKLSGLLCEPGSIYVPGNSFTIHLGNSLLDLVLPAFQMFCFLNFVSFETWLPPGTFWDFMRWCISDS